MSCLLWPNVGAEEGEGGAAPPASRAVAALWRLLFGAEARGEEAAWPPDLGPEPRAPAFDWLSGEHAFAWLNSDEAARRAAACGLPLAGAAPEVVRRVHDKGFAHAVALEEGLLPLALRGAIDVFEPGDLADADAALRRIRAHVERHAEAFGGRFALKPRVACAGRGRVAVDAGRLDPAALRGALPRLAARGGALLEPWLERVEDLSAQLHVGADGSLTLLGTARQRVSSAGVFRGHGGEVDSRGRVRSGSVHDEALREAAAALGRAAAAAGYRGPCGVDAFAYREPGGGVALRPAVELNARFTVGTVAVGLVRRALPRVREALGLASGRLLAFSFALEPPAGGWPAEDAALLRIALSPGGASGGAALLFAADPGALERAPG